MRGIGRARVVALATVVLGLLAAPQSSFALEGTPGQVGQWGSLMTWPVQGKHMTLLHNGKVLVWAKGEEAHVWDPTTGSITAKPAPFGDIHCGAQVTLADGRVMVVGGQNGGTHIGIPTTSIYNPLTNTWSRGADMAYGRWYPTLTTMADGRTFVSSGDDEGKARVDTPEIYDPVADRWTSTTPRSQGLYPFTYQMPNGKLYEAGTKTSTAFFDATTEPGRPARRRSSAVRPTRSPARCTRPARSFAPAAATRRSPARRSSTGPPRARPGPRRRPWPTRAGA